MTDARGMVELDAQLIADVEALQLSARQLAVGAAAGMHRSPRRGSWIEFLEHKLYAPGDDIRRIDWRAFAKTDRYHVKNYEDETNLFLEILLDTSASMDFASEGLRPKLEIARQLAAALAYLALRQGDATGLVSFATTVVDRLPARATGSHLFEVLARLATMRPEGETSLTKSLDLFGQPTRRRSMLVIFSDLFDPAPTVMDAFRRLAARRHDIVLIHLLDPAELEFPYENPAMFSAMEDQRRLFVHPRTLRASFVREMRAFLDRTHRTLAEMGVEYRRVMTNDDLTLALGDFLRGRQGQI